MAVSFVVVPQWQGSGSSRAMRLVDGADAIRGDLPAASTRVVAVPLEAGDDQGTGIHRVSAIAMVRDRLCELLADTPAPVVTIGGDCGVELGAVGHVIAGSADVAVLWFDAHPDLNTADTSPSRAFAGMVLRTLLGDGPEQLVPAVLLDPARIVLVGARSFDPAEDFFLAGSGIRSIGVDEVSAQALIAAVVASGATSVYLHIDFDVIDPSDFSGIGNPEPFGIGAGVLVETIRGLLARFPLAGAGITGFAPATVDSAVEDMPTILSIIGALASAG